MTTTERHPLADAYLRRLHRSAARLPRSQREELVAEIEDHIAAGLESARSEVEIRTLLEDLGDPEEIVAEALPPGRPPARGGGTALALGVIGAVVALVPVLGAFVAIPLGIAAIGMGVSARRAARDAGVSSATATAAVTAGIVAVSLPILLIVFLLPVGLGYDSSPSPVDVGPAVPMETAPTR